ncbi:Uncharacterised protein [BD1-7 clade bacterium]|uniref:Uncharacterized protein n=1 Tax=BD1-7 clade bacterium TaxID=2029982 RepID=A0A5S9PCY7_9GAMM|nr:Uncharacterised protein [BD1-7 clade bacterium]
MSSARNTRIEYHDGLEKKRKMISTLRAQGLSDEEIAKQIVDSRNQDRLSHYKTPEALDVVYKRNLKKYQNKTALPTSPNLKNTAGLKALLMLR